MALVSNPLGTADTREFSFFVCVSSAVYKFLLVIFSLAFLAVYWGAGLTIAPCAVLPKQDVTLLGPQSNPVCPLSPDPALHPCLFLWLPDPRRPQSLSLFMASPRCASSSLSSLAVAAVV